MYHKDQIKDLLRQSGGIDRGLHPLAKATIKQSVLKSIAGGDLNIFLIPKRYDIYDVKVLALKFTAFSLIGILAVTGTVYASDNSKPGDVLYSVKRVDEQVQLQLKFSEESKAVLHAKFAEERVAELTDVRKTAEVNTEHVRKAEAEVHDAVEKLTEVKSKLESKGNTQAAVSVGQALERIKTDSGIGARVESAQDEKEEDDENDESLERESEDSEDQDKVEDEEKVEDNSDDLEDDSDDEDRDNEEELEDET